MVKCRVRSRRRHSRTGMLMQERVDRRDRKYHDRDRDRERSKSPVRTACPGRLWRIDLPREHGLVQGLAFCWPRRRILPDPLPRRGRRLCRDHFEFPRQKIAAFCKRT